MHPVWQPGGSRAFPGRGAAGTGPVTGGRPFPRRAIPGRPPGSQDHGDIGGHRRARRVGERLTAAKRPPGLHNTEVFDTAIPTAACDLHQLLALRLVLVESSACSAPWPVARRQVSSHDCISGTCTQRIFLETGASEASEITGWVQAAAAGAPFPP